MDYIFAIILFAFIMAILTSTIEVFYSEQKIKLRTIVLRNKERKNNQVFQKKVNWKEELNQLLQIFGLRLNTDKIVNIISSFLLVIK